MLLEALETLSAPYAAYEPPPPRLNASVEPAMQISAPPAVEDRKPSFWEELGKNFEKFMKKDEQGAAAAAASTAFVPAATSVAYAPAAAGAA